MYIEDYAKKVEVLEDFYYYELVEKGLYPIVKEYGYSWIVIANPNPQRINMKIKLEYLPGGKFKYVY